MVGIDRTWGDASIALLGVDFDDEFGKIDPPLEPDRLPNFHPCRIFGGLWELAVAAAEAPAVALSNQLLFI